MGGILYYFSIVGWFLHLEVGIISFSLLSLMIYISLVHDKFYLVLYDK